MRAKMFPLCFVFASSLICSFGVANAANSTQEDAMKRMKRASEDWIEIANKLESCEAYQKKVADLLTIFTEKLSDVKIKGIAGGKCLYTQRNS